MNAPHPTGTIVRVVICEQGEIIGKTFEGATRYTIKMADGMQIVDVPADRLTVIDDAPDMDERVGARAGEHRRERR